MFGQMKRSKSIGVLTLVGALSLSQLASAEAIFYRYVDANGQRVITQTLPPKMAKRGYEVVNVRGDVIRKVEAALSEEAYAKLKADQEAAKRQAEADRQLLIRFRSLSEIDIARERRVNDIQYNQTMVKASLEHEIQELARLTRKAADLERKELEVNETLKHSIDTTREGIQSRRQQLADYDQQLVGIAREFELYTERFKYLSSRAIQ